MVKPTKVLVPLDFGPTSENVLSYASLLAGGFGAKLHVLHVLTDSRVQEVSARGSIRVLDQMEKELRERLSNLVEQELSESARDAEIGVSIGVPFAEILRYAEEHGINLIVMGSHGMTSVLETIMVGSVAEKVVRRAHCPVVIVRQAPEEIGDSKAT